MNKIILGDCIQVLARQRENCARLIVADPPYFNVLLQEDWDTRWQNSDEYLEWSQDWMRAAFRVLQPGGLLYCFGQTGKREHAFFHLMSQATREYSNSFHDLIVWDRCVGYSTRRDSFTPATEMILVLRKDGAAPYFDKSAVREPYDEKQIEIYAKDKRYKNKAARMEHLNAGKFATNLWRIPSLKGAAKEKIGSITLSISFGQGTKYTEAESIQDIFKKAEDDMYRHKLYESGSTRSQTIGLIMTTLYEKSHREMHHSKRVSEICIEIAAMMNFDEEATNRIGIAGLMHDIGKIGIDENILNKAEKLNPDEWREMQRHPEIGYRILSSANEFSEMAKYVLEHQEKWDGSGYPKGIKGKEISLEARIISVADAYDAMTSDRPYRKKICDEEAISEIEKNTGTQFDPEIVKIFIEKHTQAG